MAEVGDSGTGAGAEAGLVLRDGGGDALASGEADAASRDCDWGSLAFLRRPPSLLGFDVALSLALDLEFEPESDSVSDLDLDFLGGSGDSEAVLVARWARRDALRVPVPASVSFPRVGAEGAGGCFFRPPSRFGGFRVALALGGGEDDGSRSSSSSSDSVSSSSWA